MFNKIGPKRYLISLLIFSFFLIPSLAYAVTFETVQDLWVDGNAGIGTTNPQYRLDVSGSARITDGGLIKLYTGGSGADDYTIRVMNAGPYPLQVSLAGDASTNRYFQIGYHDTGVFQPKFVVNSYTGYVGIAKTSPAYALDVAGDIRLTGNLYAPAVGNYQQGYWQRTGSNIYPIDTTYNVGIGTASPTQKLHVLGTYFLLENPSAEATIQLKDQASTVYLSHGGWGIGATKFGIGDGATPKLVVDTTGGNVGIGTASPRGRLDVLTANNAGFYLTDSTSYPRFYFGGSSTSVASVFNRVNTGGSFYFGENADAGAFYVRNSGALYLGNDTTPAIYASSGNNGNVGIGTTSPAAKLYISSDTTSDGLFIDILQSPRITLRDRGNSDTILGVTGTAGQDNFFLSTWNVPNALVINGTSGNVGIGSATPTAKLDVNGDIRLGSGTRGRSIYNSYMALGETLSAASTILGNNIKASPTVATNVVRFANGTDPGNFIKEAYNVGITFHTNITSDLGVDIAETTNEKMRIDLGGNVGIGTASPQALLHVNSYARFDRGTLQFTLNPSYGGSNVYSQLQSTGALALAAGGDSNKVYITTGGNVGIGTANPATRLEVIGNSGWGVRIGGSSDAAYNTPNGIYYGQSDSSYANALNLLEMVPTVTPGRNNTLIQLHSAETGTSSRI